MNTEVELAQVQEGLFAYEKLTKGDTSGLRLILLLTNRRADLLTVDGMIAANTLLPVRMEFLCLNKPAA